MAPRNVLNLNQKTKYKQSYNLPTIEQLKEEYNDFFDTTSEYNVSYNYKDQNTKTKLVVKNNKTTPYMYDIDVVMKDAIKCAENTNRACGINAVPGPINVQSSGDPKKTIVYTIDETNVLIPYTDTFITSEKDILLNPYANNDQSYGPWPITLLQFNKNSKTVNLLISTSSVASDYQKLFVLIKDIEINSN